MKSKSFIVLLIVFSICCGSFATGQRAYVKSRIENLNDLNWKRFSLGLQLGTNYFQFYRFKLDSEVEGLSGRNRELPKIETMNGIGFNVGGMVKYRLNDFIQLSMEPSVYFGRPQAIVENEFDLEITPHIVSLPFLIEIGTFRINNFRPYFTTGFSFNSDIGRDKSPLFGDYDINKVDFNKKQVEFNYEVGFGVDLLLYRFRVTPSVRWSISSQNFMDPKNKDELHISTARSTAFLFNIGVSPY